MLHTDTRDADLSLLAGAETQYLRPSHLLWPLCIVDVKHEQYSCPSLQPFYVRFSAAWTLQPYQALLARWYIQLRWKSYNLEGSECLHLGRRMRKMLYRLARDT